MLARRRCALRSRGARFGPPGLVLDGSRRTGAAACRVRSVGVGRIVSPSALVPFLRTNAGSADAETADGASPPSSYRPSARSVFVSTESLRATRPQLRRAVYLGLNVRGCVQPDVMAE